MGLDGVELVMAFEEEFKIEISDAQAEKMMTVGDSVNIIYDLLRPKLPSDQCFSQYSFYQVRKLLMEIYGLPRIAVKVDSKLADIIPMEDRAKKWKILMKKLTGQYWFRELVRSEKLKLRIFLISITSLVVSLSLLPHNFLGLSLPIALIVLYLCCLLTRNSKKVYFPLGYRMVRDLLSLVPHPENCPLSKEEIFHKVVECAVDQLGVRAEQVKLESKWVDDLGVG